MSTSPSPLSPKSPKSPTSPKRGSRADNEPGSGTRSPVNSPPIRERSGSWLGKFGESRRRSGSVQAPGSPSMSRGKRSPSVSQERGRSLSLSLESAESTIPEVLGALMLSPRADRLEGEYAIEHQNEVKNAQLLNHAGLSEFYMAEFKGEKVLQKVIKYRNIDDKVLASFEKEVAVLSTLQHPNIVRFIGAKATPPDLFMVLEWMARGSLSTLLLKDLSTEIAWTQRIRWAQNVATGIAYLHSMRPKIIHRDLRADNVMVDEHGVAKVSEFGLSRRKRFAMKASPKGSHEVPDDHQDKGKEEHSHYHFVSEGGPAYTAPELLQSQPYTEKVDAFNYGILLWQLMTRQEPHRGMTPMEVAEAVVQNNLRPSVPDFVPEELATLMQTCWLTDEAKRLSFEEMLVKLESLLSLDPELPAEDVESSAADASVEQDAAKPESKGEFNEFL